MKGSGLKLSPEAMKKLMVIGEKQGTISLKDLSCEMGLTSEDTLVFLRQIFPHGIGAEIYNRDNECMVDIDANAIQYMLPLSPSEWMGLHQLLSSQKSPALNTLKKKITENGPIKAVMELLNQLDQWDLQLSEVHQNLVTTLDEAVSQKLMVGITTAAGKTYQMFPCKIIHLEGQLSMIAEDANDHCLVVMSISELKEVSILEAMSAPQVASFEVDEFVVAIRSMNEKETRLILKIHDPQTVNLFPDHHFLGKPCMITNPNGDLIWAAYVEPCDDLFEWLLKLGTNVEVLDPGKFKDEYLLYCEEKLRKVA
ncbi:MAG: WYL domain-containing protein [Bdellovibrionales bacterium]|nr:WYL domain-containing protein [Bdellovibrionales bacterium]